MVVGESREIALRPEPSGALSGDIEQFARFRFYLLLTVQFPAFRGIEYSPHIGKRVEAVQALQTFVNENCGRVEQEYRELGQSLPPKLQIVGVEYLFTNYMKEWTSRAAVPLPLP